MAEDGWDRTKRGTIMANPLTSFQSSEGGLRLIWRLEWTEAKPGSTLRRAKSVQLHLDAETALQIGEEIVRSAKATLAGPIGGSGVQ